MSKNMRKRNLGDGRLCLRVIRCVIEGNRRDIS
jgi:hypothetical protein